MKTRFLVFALVAAVQLAGWSSAMPACASMAGCGAPVQALHGHCQPPATITGTASCCSGGTVEAPAAISAPPERTLTATCMTATAALQFAQPSSPAADSFTRGADGAPPLLPLAQSGVLRI